MALADLLSAFGGDVPVADNVPAAWTPAPAQPSGLIGGSRPAPGPLASSSPIAANDGSATPTVDPLQTEPLPKMSAWDLIPHVMAGKSVPEAAAAVQQSQTDASGFAPPPLPQQSNHLGDFLDSILFDGALRKTRDAAYNKQLAGYQAQRAYQIGQSIQDPAERAAYYADPTAYAAAKDTAYAAANLKAEEARYIPGKGIVAIAPKLFNDPTNGVNGVINGDGTSAISGYPTIQKKDASQTVGPLAPVVGPSAIAGSSIPASSGIAPGASPGIGPASIVGDPTAPRGLRNNNPYNVKALPSGQQWLGQTGVDQGGYAQFADPAMGQRAADRVLTNYGKNDGINTVSGAISRWAPASAGNATAPYIAHVAQALGVGPNDKIDLSDPNVRKTMLGAMGQVENGPQAFAAFQAAQGGGIPSSVPAAAQPASAGLPTSMGATPVSPEYFDPTKEAFVQKQPDGTIKETGKPAYTAELKNTIQHQLADSELAKGYHVANTAFQSLAANADKRDPTTAYAALDQLIKIINFPLGARVGNIDALQEQRGPALSALGGLQKLLGQGGVTKQQYQQTLDTALPYVKTMYSALKQENDANASLAQRKGFDPRDVTIPLGGAPAAHHIDVPPPPGRVKGDTYSTPKGALQWTGTGWLPAN